MAAKSTKDIRVYLSDGSDPAKLAPTSITKAAPALVTVTDVSTLMAGDPVTAVRTGFAELDGKTFVVGEVDDTEHTFTLIGSDTTASTGALASSPELQVYQAENLVRLCLAELTFNPETPGTIAVGTFCDPSATLPATATGAGTATLTGFVDVSDPGYSALLEAEADGVTRMLQMVLPQGQGYLIAPMTISSVTWQTPLEGGIGFTANAALASKPVHRFTPPAP